MFTGKRLKTKTKTEKIEKEEIVTLHKKERSGSIDHEADDTAEPLPVRLRRPKDHPDGPRDEHFSILEHRNDGGDGWGEVNGSDGCGGGGGWGEEDGGGKEAKSVDDVGEGQIQDWEPPKQRPHTPRASAPPPSAATRRAQRPVSGAPYSDPARGIPHSTSHVLTSASQVAQRAATARSSRDQGLASAYQYTQQLPQRPSYYWDGPTDRKTKLASTMAPTYTTTMTKPAPTSIYNNWGQPKDVDPWGDPKPILKPKSLGKPGQKQAWESWAKEAAQQPRARSTHARRAHYVDDEDEYSSDESEQTYAADEFLGRTTKSGRYASPQRPKVTLFPVGAAGGGTKNNSYAHYAQKQQKQSQPQYKSKKDQSWHYEEEKAKKKHQNEQASDWENSGGWKENGEAWADGGGWENDEDDGGWQDGGQDGWGKPGGDDNTWGQSYNGHDKGVSESRVDHGDDWDHSDSKHDKGWSKSSNGHDKGWGDGDWGNKENADDNERSNSRRNDAKKLAWNESQTETHSTQSKTMMHAHKGTSFPNLNARQTQKMSDYHFFESNGMAFSKVHNAIFGRERKVKDRIHWMFSPDKDERVSALMKWIEGMEQSMGSYGLRHFLQTRERGALFVNANYREEGHPHDPAFDWLSFEQVQETRDPIIQNSVIHYDPAMMVYIFVFLPSVSGNSVAMWRKKVPIPDHTRLKFQKEIAVAKSGLKRDQNYVVHVDELPMAEKVRAKIHKRTRPLPSGPGDRKKKRKWWQVLRFAE